MNIVVHRPLSSSVLNTFVLTRFSIPYLLLYQNHLCSVYFFPALSPGKHDNFYVSKFLWPVFAPGKHEKTMDFLLFSGGVKQHVHH